MNTKSIKLGFLFVSFLALMGISAASFAAVEMETVLTDKENGTEEVDVFTPDTPMIYLNWKSKDIHPGQKIKSVWIADDTGGAAPDNYKINEYTAEVKDNSDNGKSGGTTTGTFNVNKPTTAAGWPVGDYHLDIYVDGKHVKKVEFSVEKASD